ncbi:hypothetical protein [Winogradskyella sp.]
MKNIILLSLLAFCLHTVYAQKTINIEAEGNLESTKPCDCVEISEITNAHNPADILHGMGKCIEEKEFYKAARLFAIAGVYGKFDSYRVKDKSAHKALYVLQQNTMLKVAEEDKNVLIAELQKTLKEESEELKEVCKAIRAIGMPNYHPTYMIQHGMQAFLQTEGDGLVEDFDAEASWQLALSTYLHCEK